MIKDILFNNRKIIRSLYSETSERLTTIIKPYFEDFDNVEVSCSDYEDAILLKKDNKSIRLKLSAVAYANGSHVRRDSRNSKSEFNKIEIEDIKNRLNELFKN